MIPESWMVRFGTGTDGVVRLRHWAVFVVRSAVAGSIKAGG